MRRISALAVILLSVALTMTLTPSAMAAQANQTHKPVLSARGPCGQAIQVFHRTGQPIDKWLVRITGPDLIKKVAPALRGEAIISIDDADGGRSITKPFDQHSPLNTYVYVNGATATIAVNVNPTPANGNGCDDKVVIKH